MRFTFFSWLNSMRPKPFKWLQRYLDVETEWSQFKSIVRPHRGLFLILSGVVFYPVYSPMFSDVKEIALRSLSNNLKKEEPIPRIAESFGKQLISGVFADTLVQRDSAIFVQDLVKRQAVLDAVLALLVKTISNPLFLNETTQFSKVLVADILKDEATLKHTLALLLGVVKDAEFKQEVVETLKFAFSQPDVTEVIVNLMKTAINDDRCRAALSSAAGATVNDILMDKETLEKLKFFIYFVLESETSSQNGSVKQIIDQVVDNVLRRKVENPKDEEFTRIFAQQKTEDNLAFRDRIRNLRAETASVAGGTNSESTATATAFFEAEKQKKKFFL